MHKCLRFYYIWGKHKIDKMKKLLFVALLGFGLSVLGQTKKTELFSDSFGGVKVSQQKSEGGEIGVLITTMLSFQNLQYQQISDLKYIFVSNKEDLNILISKFEDALAFSKSGEKSEMEFEDKKIKFNITADGKSGRITLWSYRGASGFIFVHPKNISKIIEALKVIKDNYDK